MSEPARMAGGVTQRDRLGLGKSGLYACRDVSTAMAEGAWREQARELSLTVLQWPWSPVEVFPESGKKQLSPTCSRQPLVIVPDVRRLAMSAPGAKERTAINEEAHCGRGDARGFRVLGGAPLFSTTGAPTSVGLA